MWKIVFIPIKYTLVACFHVRENRIVKNDSRAFLISVRRKYIFETEKNSREYFTTLMF